MYNMPEQVTEFNRSALDAALQLGRIALDTTERLVGLQLVATRETLAGASQSLKPMIEARDLQTLLDLRAKLTANSIENAAAYSHSLFEVANDAKVQISNLLNGHLATFNQSATGNTDKVVNTPVVVAPAVKKPKPAAKKAKSSTRG